MNVALFRHMPPSIISPAPLLGWFLLGWLGWEYGLQNLSPAHQQKAGMMMQEVIIKPRLEYFPSASHTCLHSAGITDLGNIGTVISESHETGEGVMVGLGHW
jgi:hypothetical protein